ncbi:MAG: ATP-binding cassette domain-containing protein, partial [Microbacteriaceae bacterium]|nr:ATP-binding cassette domain-containing protein [Microbacteriaceae bacterium]
MLSVLTIHDATLVVDGKQLWKDLNLEVKPGEFIAIIGANGSGKTSLLKAILGQIKLTKGNIRFELELVGNGNNHIGYIPQQRALDDAANILVKDLVRFGYSGHKLGVFSAFGKTSKKVKDALACADAV